MGMVNSWLDGIRSRRPPRLTRREIRAREWGPEAGTVFRTNPGVPASQPFPRGS